MKSLIRLQGKLNYLQHQLATFQAKGVKKAFKIIVINIIFAIKKLELLIEQIKKTTEVQFRELELNTPKKAWRAWVAKISAQKDKKYGGFTKEFIEPISREFGKKGEISAIFNIPIDLHQIYQDSDGEFWMFENLDGDIKVICYQEVCYRFSQIPF